MIYGGSEPPGERANDTVITGERHRDNLACVLGGAISHLNVETCCVRQLCPFKISFVSLIQKWVRLFQVTFS